MPNGSLSQIMVVLSSESEFLSYAMKCYDNPSVSLEAFQEDLGRIDSLGKQFSKYINQGVINERLVLNHIIILFNVFGAGAPDLLLYKTRKEHLNILKTFMIYLQVWPDKLIEVSINNEIATKLRNL